MTDQFQLMVEELLRLEADLSCKEIDFIESIDGMEGDLSEKQGDWLRAIWERCT